MTERGAEMTEHQTDRNPPPPSERVSGNQVHTHTRTRARHKAATALLSFLPSSVAFPCVSACPWQSMKVRGMKPRILCASARDAGSIGEA